MFSILSSLYILYIDPCQHIDITECAQVPSIKGTLVSTQVQLKFFFLFPVCLLCSQSPLPYRSLLISCCHISQFFWLLLVLLELYSESSCEYLNIEAFCPFSQAQHLWRQCSLIYLYDIVQHAKYESNFTFNTGRHPVLSVQFVEWTFFSKKF